MPACAATGAGAEAAMMGGGFFFRLRAAPAVCMVCWSKARRAAFLAGGGGSGMGSGDGFGKMGVTSAVGDGASTLTIGNAKSRQVTLTAFGDR